MALLGAIEDVFEPAGIEKAVTPAVEGVDISAVEALGGPRRKIAKPMARQSLQKLGLPSRRTISTPVVASQTRAVRSREPLTTREPSELNNAVQTWSV